MASRAMSEPAPDSCTIQTLSLGEIDNGIPICRHVPIVWHKRRRARRGSGRGVPRCGPSDRRASRSKASEANTVDLGQMRSAPRGSRGCCYPARRRDRERLGVWINLRPLGPRAAPPIQTGAGGKNILADRFGDRRAAAIGTGDDDGQGDGLQGIACEL